MNMITEPARNIPVTAEADVCVLGGSCTGVFAAVRAARLGMRVILIEKLRKRAPLVEGTEQLTWRTALFVGCFQVLSLVPGTSRSGATILGGILLGLSRPVAAEFSFFLGIPTMAGAGLLKGVKFFAEGNSLATVELVVLLVAAVTAFLTSLAVIRFLMDFVRRHSFASFGVYRILLGGAVLAAFFLGAI